MSNLDGRMLGKYLLVRPVGQGGMATVYLALDTSVQTYVALKVLGPLQAQNRTFLLRFRREAKVVMRLRHPNIVPLEDWGEVGDFAYLAMPYLEGGSLSDRLRQGSLSDPESQRLIGQVASALQHAHDQGIVHRDVKPSNILQDSHGNAMLSDFGLAQIQDASVSLTGSGLLGTPSYISPEQVRGDRVDGRSDQYALGIVLFQITTGRLPFEAETPLAVLAQQANKPLPRPRSLNPRISQSVELVILRATAKNPEDRFLSIAEMDRSFQQAVAHALDPSRHKAPTIKLPATSARADDRSARRSRRRLLLSGVLAGGFVLLFAAMAIWEAFQQSAAGGSAAAQLTALQETIAALSTTVAGSGGGLSPDAIATIVAATLGSPSLGPTQPAPTNSTLSATATPPATGRPTASATPRPAGTTQPAATVAPPTNPPPTNPPPTSPPTSTPIIQLPTLPLPTPQLPIIPNL